MKKFESFKILNYLDPYQNCINLKKFIDFNLNNQKLNFFFVKIEKIFNVPVEIQKRKVGKLITNNFNYEANSFAVNNNYIKIICDFLLLKILIIFNIFFSTLSLKKKKFDIILANTDGDFGRLDFFLKHFSNIAIISKKKDEYYKYKKMFPKKNFLHFRSFFLHYKFNIVNLISFFSIYFKILYFSLSTKQNYIFFFNRLLVSILTYSSLSKLVVSKRLIYGRLYWTCPIINYFFKKNQKTISCVIQSHIIDIFWALYMDSDIYFSFGKNNEQKKEIFLVGGRIKKIIPIGSLLLEKNFKKRKKSFDIMIVISNLDYWYNFSNIPVSYNKFFYWIIRLAKDFPKKKIIFFCFENDTDQQKKIMTLIKDNNIYGELVIKTGACYEFVNNVKFVFSYVSTFILEAISLGKKAYFLQPEVGTTSILKKKYLNKIIIKKYSFLKKILNKNCKKKIIKKDICIPSNKASQNMFNFFKK